MFADWPFHITHRGNQRKLVFRSDVDRRAYLGLLQQYSVRFGTAIWAYCLMPNHVHLIAVGKHRSSISKTMGNTNRAFSRRVNRANDVTGHLWANRYFSSAVDDAHLWAAVRYVELNPVRGGLVDHAVDYPWSSAPAHAGRTRDSLLHPDRPFPGHIGDWAAWLEAGLEDEVADRLRENTSTGRPTGNERFIRDIERKLGRRLRPKRARRGR